MHPEVVLLGPGRSSSPYRRQLRLTYRPVAYGVGMASPAAAVPAQPDVASRRLLLQPLSPALASPTRHLRRHIRWLERLGRLEQRPGLVRVPAFFLLIVVALSLGLAGVTGFSARDARAERYIQNVIRDGDATKGSGSRLLRLLLEENTWPGETLALHARAAPVSRREHPDVQERGDAWERRQAELIVMYEALGFERVHKDQKHPLMVRVGT